MTSYTVLVPNAAKDAKQLWKAIHSKDGELTIINILGHRNVYQRQVIRKVYQEKYGNSLLIALCNNITGEFLRSISLWIFPPCVRDAILIHEAIEYISDWGNILRRRQEITSKILVEIFCSRSPEELDLVKNSYYTHFKKHIGEEVQSHYSRYIGNFLTKLVSIHRNTRNEINVPLVKQQAKELHNKIVTKHYNDDVMIEILVTRSKTEIREIVNEYKKLFRCDILTRLQCSQEDFKDELCALFITTIKCLLDPVDYYAGILRNSVKMHDDHTLTRVVITRAEVDLQNIKTVCCKPLDALSLDYSIGNHTNHRIMLLHLLGDLGQLGI